MSSQVTLFCIYVASDCDLPLRVNETLLEFDVHDLWLPRMRASICAMAA